MARVRAYKLAMTMPAMLVFVGLALAFLGSGAISAVGGTIFIMGFITSAIVRICIVCPSCGKSPMQSDGVWPLVVRRMTPEFDCSKCGYDLAGISEAKNDHL